jgi:hypothetical protein
VVDKDLDEIVSMYLWILEIAVACGPADAIAMLEDLHESPFRSPVLQFQCKEALLTLRRHLESSHGAELDRFDDRVRKEIQKKIQELKRHRAMSDKVREERTDPKPELPVGDELETWPAKVDQIPREVLDSALRVRDRRVDVVLLDVRDRRGSDDALEWVAGWEEAIRRGGSSCRARAPRLAVVGIGFDAGFMSSLEKKGIFVVDQRRDRFDPDPKTAVRQRLHQILCGGARSQLLLRSDLPNPFGLEGGPLESEADPSYETMPVSDQAASDKFIDSLRRGRRADSD